MYRLIIIMFSTNTVNIKTVDDEVRGTKVGDTKFISTET